MASICEGLKVADFSWGVAGPLASMVLADFGAEVVKVEPPGGDPFRKMPGAVQWHRGKKSVVLNLKEREGREAAQRLAETSDILIESFRPGVADRLGIGYTELSGRNPRLIYCSISAFGQKGPWSHIKGYEAVIPARTGLMAVKAGWRPSGPIFQVLLQASVGAANFALQGIFGALRLRGEAGHGYRVETSLLQGAINYQFQGTYRWEETAHPPAQTAGLEVRDPLSNVAGYRVCRCKDGRWVQLGCFQTDMFHKLLRAIGMEEESRDPRCRRGPQFDTEEDRLFITRRIEEQIAKRAFDEWARIFEEVDIPYAPHLTTQEFMDHPQAKALGLVVPVRDNTLGDTEQVGPPFHLRDSGWKIRRGAPAPDEHHRELLEALRTVRQPTPVRASPDSQRQMLEGITVIEAATYVAAPAGVAYLADYGASIIKIDPPGGDPLRTWGDNTARTGRGKRSIGIDLKRKEGQEVLYRLIERADVFVHNFRPGVSERLRIDYKTLSKINPRLVYCHATSYGSTGPLAGRPAFDPVVSALTGGTSAQAGRGNPPQIHNTSDMGAGLMLTTALMVALYQRDRTGQGQELETQMLSAAAYLHSDDFLRYRGKPPRLLADKGQHGLHALYRLYEAKEGWVFLAVVTQKEWERFCLTTGMSHWLQDPRFATADARRAHDAELIAALGEVFRGRSAEEWERLLTAAAVACVCAHQPYGTLLFDHEHMRQNVGAIHGRHPDWGDLVHPGPLVRLPGLPVVTSLASSRLGENTDAILTELRYVPEDIRRLRQEKVVF